MQNIQTNIVALLLTGSLAAGCFSTGIDSDSGPGSDSTLPDTDSGMPGTDAMVMGTDAFASDSAVASDSATGTDAATGVAGEITCDTLTCTVPGEACQICNPGEPGPIATCEVGMMFPNCAVWGVMYPPLFMECDGAEDCAVGEACYLLEGSLGTYAQCWDEATFAPECAAAWSTRLCNTVADCPVCATGCGPYQPGHPVNVCQF